MNILDCPYCGNQPIKILVDRKLQRQCCGATFENDRDWNRYVTAIRFTNNTILYDIIEDVYRQVWKDNKSKDGKQEIQKMYECILNLKERSYKDINRKYFDFL